jgi:hypothetical protein
MDDPFDFLKKNGFLKKNLKNEYFFTKKKFPK